MITSMPSRCSVFTNVLRKPCRFAPLSGATCERTRPATPTPAPTRARPQDSRRPRPNQHTLIFGSGSGPSALGQGRWAALDFAVPQGLGAEARWRVLGVRSVAATHRAPAATNHSGEWCVEGLKRDRRAARSVWAACSASASSAPNCATRWAGSAPGRRSSSRRSGPSTRSMTIARVWPSTTGTGDASCCRGGLQASPVNVTGPDSANTGAALATTIAGSPHRGGPWRPWLSDRAQSSMITRPPSASIAST